MARARARDIFLQIGFGKGGEGGKRNTAKNRGETRDASDMRADE